MDVMVFASDWIRISHCQPWSVPHALWHTSCRVDSMMLIRSLPLLLLTVACSASQDSLCLTSEAPVPISANTAAGTPESLLDMVLGEEQHTLRGPALGAVPLQMEVRWNGEEASWEDREPNAEAEGMGSFEDSHVCSDALLVPVELRFRTQDGQFDEQWSVVLTSTQAGRVVLDHELDASALDGTWRPDVQGYDSTRLRVHAEWTEDGSEGVLTAIARPVDGGPDQVWDVAVWPG